MLSKKIISISLAVVILINFQIYDIDPFCILESGDEAQSSLKIPLSYALMFGAHKSEPRDFLSEPRDFAQPLIKPHDFSSHDFPVPEPPSEAEDFYDYITSNSSTKIKGLTNIFKQASIEEAQNTYNILNYLDHPSQMKIVLKNLDSGNLSKILGNLPKQELEKIYNTLDPHETLDIFLNLNLNTNECISNNVTSTKTNMNYTLLQICKR